MAKALTIMSIVTAILLLALFGLDLAVGFPLPQSIRDDGHHLRRSRIGAWLRQLERVSRTPLGNRAKVIQQAELGMLGRSKHRLLGRIAGLRWA